MECPTCGSKIINLISCGCDDLDCQDLLECCECQSVFNIGK